MNNQHLDACNVPASAIPLPIEVVGVLFASLIPDLIGFLDSRGVVPCDGRGVIGSIAESVVKKYGQFTGGNFRAWVFRIARNEQVNCWRREKSLRQRQPSHGPSTFTQIADPKAEDPVSAAVSIEIDIDKQQEKQKLHQSVRTCLLFLEELERQILVFTYYGDGVLKPKKVAEILSITSEHTSNKKHAAHKKMKACLACRKHLPPEQIASLDSAVSEAQPPGDSQKFIEWMLSTRTAVKFPTESAEKLAKCIKNEGNSASPSQTGGQP